MSNQSSVDLADFIQSVKKELLKSSKISEEEKKEKGINPLLQLNAVELEVNFTVERELGCDAKFYVINAGSSIQSTQYQSAKLHFNIIPPHAPPNGLGKGITMDENGDYAIPIHVDNTNNFGGLLHVSRQDILDATLNIPTELEEQKE